MGLEKIACQVAAEQEGQRLDQFLAQSLAPRFSRRRIRRLIDAGAVYVDGKRLRVASRPVRRESRVEVYVEPAPSTPPVRIAEHHVLYEDDALIAVDKPPGLPSQPTVGDAVHDLFSQLRRFLSERDGRRGAREPYLALHHRLDRGTSGVILFAKSRRANRGIAEAFSQRRVRKVYHALCKLTAERPPEGAWTVHNHLSPPREAPDGRRMVVADVSGRTAETEFRTLQSFPGALWIEAIPKTGRTHQIRVHLADSGLPVLGDPLYGRGALPKIPAERLMLHAVSLTLEHPTTGEALVLESPLPDDFRRQVRRLEYEETEEVPA